MGQLEYWAYKVGQTNGEDLLSCRTVILDPSGGPESVVDIDVTCNQIEIWLS
jgi:hypothetical protein